MTVSIDDGGAKAFGQLNPPSAGCVGKLGNHFAASRDVLPRDLEEVLARAIVSKLIPP
jgi:hypothetical protein